MRNRNLSMGLQLLLALGVVAGAVSGCRPTTLREQVAGPSRTQAVSAERPLDGGTYCVQTIEQGPPVPRPVHFSYKEQESEGSSKDYEADLVGDNFDVTMNVRRPATEMDKELSGVPGAKPVAIQNGFVQTSNTIHYARSDKSGWMSGSNMIVLGVTPWNLFVAKPNAHAVGAEHVSGYDAIKYAIDTTHQSATDKWAFNTAWRTRNYDITGTAWATRDTGCVLQYSIDLERDGSDGKVEKSHFEGGVSAL